jgi:hypothetical protein
MWMGKLKAWVILLCIVGSLLAPGLLPAQEDAVTVERAVPVLLERTLTTRPMTKRSIWAIEFFSRLQQFHKVKTHKLPLVSLIENFVIHPGTMQKNGLTGSRSHLAAVRTASTPRPSLVALRASDREERLPKESAVLSTATGLQEEHILPFVISTKARGQIP